MTVRITIIMQATTIGVVTLRNAYRSPLPPSTSAIIIAPFLDNVNDGQVLFRLSDNETLLNQVRSIINDRLEYDFTPTMLFIVTWNRMTEYGGSSIIIVSVIIMFSHTIASCS